MQVDDIVPATSLSPVNTEDFNGREAAANLAMEKGSYGSGGSHGYK